MLIQNHISVCSVIFLLLLPEFGIHELQSQLIYWSLKNQGVEHSNLRLPEQIRMWKVLPYTVFDNRMLDGLWMQLTVGCSLSYVFFNFPWPRCLWDCERNLWTNLFFSLGPGRLVLKLIIIIIIENFVLSLLNLMYFCTKFYTIVVYLSNASTYICDHGKEVG